MNPVTADFLKVPRVVATVTQENDLHFLAKENGVACDVLEYRLDNLVNHLSETSEIVAASAVPSLITARCPAEGGANDLSESRRAELAHQFLSNAAMIDLEIASMQSSDEIRDLASDAREKNRIVIGSFHDFSGFPGRERITRAIASAYEMGADVAKIAVVIESMEELFQLVELVEKEQQSGRLISAMGMGSLGKISRLVLAKAGSCLNYGYLQTENAPGQWPAGELRELIQNI